MTNLFNLEELNPDLNDNNGPYCFNTYPVFEKCISVIPDKFIDTVMINVRTIVRNNFDKTLSRNVLVSKIMNELYTLVSDIIAIFNYNKIFKPSIVLYYYDYRVTIPKDYIRSLNQNSEYCYNMRNPILKELIKIDKFRMIDGVGVTLMLLRNVIPVYQALYNSLGNVKNNRRILMISGMPLDYHLVDKEPNLQILQSRTGKVFYKEDLSQLIFKNYDNIPFNKSTHVLLGDKKLLKPSLGLKDKRRLKELAIQEKWKLKTKLFIKESIIGNGFIFPYELS